MQFRNNEIENMSNLSYIDQRNFEKLFDMASGYVLNFSNRTFWDFVVDSIWVNPYAWEYESKANLLRRIFKEESNYKVWKLLFDLVEYFEIEYWNQENLNTILINKYKEIAVNLQNNSDVSELNIENIDNDKTLDLLLEEIRNSKDTQKPEIILDRLHTLSIKYIRKLAKKYNIETEWKTLNALYWLYIKELEKIWKIESDISLLIFKSNISILEKFNFIRNNRSLAHDNEILNSSESTFIINNIINLLHFIEKIENEPDKYDKKLSEETSVEDLPF